MNSHISLTLVGRCFSLLAKASSATSSSSTSRGLFQQTKNSFKGILDSPQSLLLDDDRGVVLKKAARPAKRSRALSRSYTTRAPSHQSKKNLSQKFTKVVDAAFLCSAASFAASPERTGLSPQTHSVGCAFRSLQSHYGTFQVSSIRFRSRVPERRSKDVST